jgi:hypothetical protein
VTTGAHSGVRGRPITDTGHLLAIGNDT